MNQLYENKCDCKQYDDLDDHRSTLIKMELPEYEDSQCSSTSYTITRAIRFICYIVVLVLLGYSLWRIKVIETTLQASDRFANISRLINAENSGLYHPRTTRSIKPSYFIEHNAFGLYEKELPRGSMLTSKNENRPLPRKKPINDDDFDYLVNLLLDKIQTMHRDTDRSHFDNNMKAVFRAWFPVFDALLPRELTNNDETINSKMLGEANENSSEVKNLRFSRDIRKSSEESSEEKEKENHKKTRSIVESSEESSEKKQLRFIRDLSKSSEESSEDPKKEKERKIRAVQKSSEESSEEKKNENDKKSDQKGTDQPQSI